MTKGNTICPPSHFMAGAKISLPFFNAFKKMYPVTKLQGHEIKNFGIKKKSKKSS
jgi:hypothetical protein